MSDVPVQGQAAPSSGANDFNAMSFLIKQMISRVNVATMVKVMAVSNAGGVAPIGTVDVQILVNQVDGAGKAVPHVTVFGLPYQRVQGGTNAIILDPQVGDIGVAVFAHSDISAVKATGASANPGSARRNSVADGLYCFSVLSSTPVQYIQFVGSEINVVSPGSVNVTTGGRTTVTATGDVVVTTQGDASITSSGETHVTATGGCVIDATTTNNGDTTINGHLTVNGPTTLNGPITQGSGAGGTTAALIGPVTVTGEVTAAGKHLSTHTHSGVTTGGGNTGGPN